MSQAEFIDLLQQTVILILLMASPVLIVAMAVGLLISLIQAVTQIQESTLTFVPKILLSLVTLIFAAPWMLNLFLSRTEQMFKTLPSLVQ